MADLALDAASGDAHTPPGRTSLWDDEGWHPAPPTLARILDLWWLFGMKLRHGPPSLLMLAARACVFAGESVLKFVDGTNPRLPEPCVELVNLVTSAVFDAWTPSPMVRLLEIEKGTSRELPRRLALGRRLLCVACLLASSFSAPLPIDFVLDHFSAAVRVPCGLDATQKWSGCFGACFRWRATGI